MRRLGSRAAEDREPQTVAATLQHPLHQCADLFDAVRLFRDVQKRIVKLRSYEIILQTSS
jgi:hypothetical protein